MFVLRMSEPTRPIPTWTTSSMRPSASPGGHGYSIQELSQRVSERLAEEPPDHVLVLSIDPGMRLLLQAEVESAVNCPVKACSPGELVADPGLALGALVVSPPGVLPTIALSDNEQKVHDALSKEEISIDEVIRHSGLPSSAVSVALLGLEMKRLVKQLPGKMFLRNT